MKNNSMYNLTFNIIFVICFLVYSVKSINLELMSNTVKYTDIVILILSGYLWLYNIILYGVSKVKFLTVTILMMFIFLSIYYRFDYFDVIYFLLFYVLLSSDNKLFKYLQLILLLLVLFSTLLLEKFGLIENLLFFREDGGIRQTLGFTHPNTLGLFIYAITMNSLYVMRESKYKLLKYSLLLIMNVYFYYITDSRTASFISLSTIIVSLLFDYIKISKKLINNRYIIGGILLFIFTIVGLSTFYTDSNYIIELNKLFSNRLYSSYIYISEYGYSLFGNNTPAILSTSSGEVIIDSGYINLILNKGIVFTLIFFVFIFYRIWINKFTYKEALIILSVFSTLIFESYGFSIFMFQILFFDYVGRKEYRE